MTKEQIHHLWRRNTKTHAEKHEHRKKNSWKYIRSKEERNGAQQRNLWEKIGKVIHTMSERRLWFFGHTARMDDNWLTKQMFDKIIRLKKKTTNVVHADTKWFKRSKHHHYIHKWQEDISIGKFHKEVFDEKNERESKQSHNIKQLRNKRSELMKRMWAERRKSE